MKNNNKDNILTHIFLPGEEEEKKIYLDLCILRDSQVMLVLKNPPVNAGDIRNIGLIPGSGRSPGEGRGNALQNPLDRGILSLLPAESHGQRSLADYST